MNVYATVQLDEGETLTKSATDLAADFLVVAGGDPATDTCQVTITATASTETPPA